VQVTRSGQASFQYKYYRQWTLQNVHVVSDCELSYLVDYSTRALYVSYIHVVEDCKNECTWYHLVGTGAEISLKINNDRIFGP
jgi:hypothetical protein